MVEVIFFFFLFLVFFVMYYQYVVVESDLDVFFFDIGYFQGNFVLFVGFLDVQGWFQYV